MLTLINSAYLLLTDKTNGAGTLMIKKRHVDDYIHKKNLPIRHNTQVEIYFTFVMQLKIDFSFICGIFSITELDMINFLGEIFPP